MRRPPGSSVSGSFNRKTARWDCRVRLETLQPLVDLALRTSFGSLFGSESLTATDSKTRGPAFFEFASNRAEKLERTNAPSFPRPAVRPGSRPLPGEPITSSWIAEIVVALSGIAASTV